MAKTKGDTKGDKAEHGGALARSPSHLLHRVLQLALDIYAEESGNGGITQRQYAVLAAVAENEGVTQTGLVRATGIDRSTLADMVARMITKGHLERQRSDQDARANTVSLTPAGAAVLEDSRPKVAMADARILALLKPSKREGFLELLADMAVSDVHAEPEAKAKKLKAPKAEKVGHGKKDKKPKKEKAAKKAA
ncbi:MULTISPECIES: MarR family winged helix-turn-helix transcriptional regulator [Caulobacter]|jgi:DNA-binding MarR family transcriptional regulator|uniref:DNA-binding MarR family transcriptional regulator n=1 Tax=Caulobacter rhizosphaerae TaxID=2010972 RepID=A0ABU1N100_9CAUL|nr:MULTISPECIES: MarR family winged helix-turn-helix transcriptional regulator [Caulobacter]KQZ29412.1 MarR family transcriptional regulator [Caulobacter sp. Root1472]MDR6532109.1 DNA-binding MarR family transcriptional regulator [Caulobacter rhizosphaerae]GGL20944.1 MarR family transcriptional regulator [Caulobacter rhizosphaerae]